MPEPIGNRKLAMAGGQVLAETRGQGGFVVAPPSIHPSGAVYTLLNLDAIKAFSADVVERVVHNHSGWVGDRYLFANGYVGAEGWHESTDCQLPRRLQGYSLAPGESIAGGLARLDDLLALAPAKVMVPLLGGVLLASISATIDAPAPMVHINGPTGCHKTSICCAAMGLAGAFLPAQPTDSWTSTPNSIQRLGWHLKDAPMLLVKRRINGARCWCWHLPAGMLDE